MDNIFQGAIDSVSHFMTGRSDIIQHYRDTYGEGGWKKHIVDDLQKQFPDAKRASLAREFQYDKRLGMERYNSPRVTAATRAKYGALGQALPRIPNKSSIEVTVKGTQRGNKGRKDRKRSVKVTLRGDKATKWVNNPNYQDLWDEFGFDFDDTEDNDYALEVESVSAA